MATDTRPLPPYCCGGAEWVLHHTSGRNVLLCTRLVGSGGALYINEEGRACRNCRHSPTSAGSDGPDFVSRIAARMARAMGPDATRTRAVLASLLQKGRTGVDMTGGPVRELFQETLVEACRRGLSPTDAYAMALDLGITRES